MIADEFHKLAGLQFGGAVSENIGGGIENEVVFGGGLLEVSKTVARENVDVRIAFEVIVFTIKLG